MLYSDCYKITYHHTTGDGYKIYLLEDISKQEFNDGRYIIFSDLEYCQQLKAKLIKELEAPKYIQERLII